MCLQDAAAHTGRALLAAVDDVYAPAPAPPSADVCDEKCQIQVRCGQLTPTRTPIRTIS